MVLSAGLCFAQGPSERNPDGEWGVPEFTLTIAAPALGQGLYLVDIQASYPSVDWNTLDRIYRIRPCGYRITRHLAGEPGTGAWAGRPRGLGGIAARRGHPRAVAR